jgi:AcrR family transcriptional regulator
METETLTRVERKKIAARNRILEAAEKLFLRKDGYNKTTIRAIAEQADVSTGAVYMHFAGKIDIMAALLDHIIVDYTENFTKIYSEKKTALQKVEDYIWHFFNFIRQPKFMAYIHYIEKLDPEEFKSGMAETIRQRHERFYVLLRDTIAEGQKDGRDRKSVV